MFGRSHTATSEAMAERNGIKLVSLDSMIDRAIFQYNAE